jgi:hypothetical protein
MGDEELEEKEGDAAPFHGVPVPGGFPPEGEDVYWFAKSSGGPTREFDDMMLRRVPGPIAHRFRGAAGARGFTHAQYLAALVALHEAMRERADGGDSEMAATLDRLGLGTVSI